MPLYRITIDIQIKGRMSTTFAKFMLNRVLHSLRLLCADHTRGMELKTSSIKKVG